MANRIKGITIEIDGDITGLDKSLKGVNTNIRNTSKALKDVERLLKIDPKNTELLAQKQKLLAQAVDQTKDKLKQLKDAEVQAKEALEKGDLGQDKYDALQREIIETENSLKKLEIQYKDTSAAMEGSTQSLSEKLKAGGEKAQEIGGKMKEVGTTVTTHVTAPIVAGAAASVAAFNEVDAAMDIIVQKTGASGQALEEMKTIAEDMATTIPTSFENAATAVGEVNTRFGVTGTELEDLSTRFVKFAELNNVDVSGSIDNTQKALSAFGLGADSAGMLLDVLNRVGQNTGVSMDALTSGLIQNGAAFQEMGLSIDQATVFMGQMEKSGANSETVMQGLRKALKNATEDGIPLNQALADLQNTIKNGKGSMDGLTASYDLFGKSGDQIYAAVKNGTVDFTALASSQSILADSADSVGKAYEGTIDPIDDAKMAMNEAKLIGSEIVESAAPMIRDALTAVRDVVKDLRTWWNGLSEDEQQNILKTLAVVAAIGPLLTILGSVISFVGTIATVVSSLIPVLGAAAAAIGAISAPVLIVIGVVAALIAIIVALVANWDKVTEAAGKFAQGVKDKWNEFKQSTKEAVDDAARRWESWKKDTGEKISSTVAAAKNKWDSMKQNAKSMAANIAQDMSSKWASIKEKTGSVFGSIRDKIGDMMGGAREKVRNAIEKIKGFFDFKWSLPKIKLPHFSITGSFSLNPPSIPYFSVDWYAKAMNKGMILNNATIFGEKDGKLLGGGEAGSETIVGTKSLFDMIRDAVASAMMAMRSVTGRTGIEAAAMQPSAVSVSYGDVNMTIHGAPGQDVRELANIVSDRLRSAYDREAKTWA